MRAYVIKSVLRRNLVAYFTSPTGYVFITIFILLSAIAAFWQDKFFLNNLANLGPLNDFFPYLLLFFVPTISMSTWADERRQGTDELLLTLPVTDLELVLGKYLSALGIYSVSLGFSLVLVLFLAALGKPDFGVMLGTYLGYWMLGASLIALGMVGSLLTPSTTIAFIFGALFCGAMIFMKHAGGLFSGAFGRFIEEVSPLEAFRDLAAGVLSLKALVHFAAMTVGGLYLNLVLLARRHIAGGQGSGLAWVHFGLRAASIAIAGMGLTVLAGRFGSRVDLTEERLHSLSAETRQLIYKIDPQKPIYIQAYVSPTAPRAFVEARETLIALLREYAAIGGARIQLRITETERYTLEAREAEEKFGIKSEKIGEVDAGRSTEEDVFLGVAMTCGTEETVIPFMHRGLSIEYELTRSIGVVSGAQRKRVGLVMNDARVMGGFNFESMSSSPAWQIVDELKKQYAIVEVQLDQPIVDAFDALVVPLPSSLTQPQMNNLLRYIHSGGPTLLVDDPFPYFSNGRLAPNEQKPRPGGMMGMGGPQGEPKGNINAFMTQIGVNWPTEDVVWDTYNPHPSFANVPQEVVFIGAASGAEPAFNPTDPITSGLQEMVVLWGGHVSARPNTPLTFTPLIRSTKQGGVLRTSEMKFGAPPHDPTGRDYVLAARIRGPVPPTPPKDGEKPTPPAIMHVVMLADCDLLSDLFFGLRRQGQEGMNFDNITFALNCIDSLAGDEAYLSVRKRRPKHRTLTKVEELTKEHSEAQLKETKDAEAGAKTKLEDAKKRLNEKIDELRKRTDIDDAQKDRIIEMAQEAEQKKLDASTKQIEDEKNQRIERSKAKTSQEIRAIQIKIRWFALPAAILAPLFIALIVVVFRVSRERRSA